MSKINNKPEYIKSKYKDFFISYTLSNKDWAEWVAWQLEEHGYTVYIQAWDFKPGSNFIDKMQEASTNTNRMIAILSNNYIEKLFTQSEWSAAFVMDPIGRSLRLIPIKVEDCELKGLMKPIVYIDLTTINDEEKAKEALLNGVKEGRNKPEKAPNFPVQERSKQNSRKLFPPIKSNSLSGQKFYKEEKFCHSLITAEGLFDINNVFNPYNCLSDPTDSQFPINMSKIYCFLWLPRNEYIISLELSSFTPIVAIFTIDPLKTKSALIKDLDYKMLERLLKIPPSKLRNEYRELFLKNIANSLTDCFIVAAAIPSLILSVGNTNPELAYQSMLSIFLLPLLEQHKRLGFEQLHVRLSQTGKKDSYLLRSAKAMVRASTLKKSGKNYSADFQKKEDSEIVIIKMARIVAWAVSSFYNSGDAQWIKFLE